MHIFCPSLAKVVDQRNTSISIKFGKSSSISYSKVVNGGK